MDERLIPLKASLESFGYRVSANDCTISVECMGKNNPIDPVVSLIITAEIEGIVHGTITFLDSIHSDISNIAPEEAVYQFHKACQDLLR